MSEAATGAAPQAERPTITLKPGAQRRVLSGHPWVYSNEIAMTPAAKALTPGTVVRLRCDDGRPLGAAMFNPHPLISARLLARDPDAAVDAAFLRERVAHALALRDKVVGTPFCRLAHAEADGLPGAVIDRFGDTVVVQTNTAGMERLLPALVEALDSLIRPASILLRNDSPARELEGLPAEVRWARGERNGPVEVNENGVRFLADLGGGQKTGWFYDQRSNRAMVARLADGARVLDVYSYSGGFALQAASAGAAEVTGIDRSAAALALAERAAALNGVESRCRFRRGEAFQELSRLDEAGERFDIVIADPPAFVKSKRELNQGARAYRKLARLAAALVRPGGFLFLASCSYHVEPALFAEQVRRGLHDAERPGRILASTGAAPDHPVHPALPETAYLKAQLLQVD